MGREVISVQNIKNNILIPKNKDKEIELYANIAIPSYVHGYSLAIEYMRNWFEKGFDKDYFKGGIYVDGKHVLDDYKYFSKNVIKGQNPRARIAPTVDFDYDREGLDNYVAPPNMYLKRSHFQTSFFRDYDNHLFLALVNKALRMNFSFKVRVATRSQQLDLLTKMRKNFRVTATQYEYLILDFHIPKSIILNIASKAGFEINNGEVKDIIGFLQYLNMHSDLPFLFKIRGINQKAEFFIRMPDVYTHISVPDKLQMDDGERDGKLDFNFHIEMNAVLTIPVPNFYAFYSADRLNYDIALKENDTGTVAIYSICTLDIPETNENGWLQGALVKYSVDEGDTEIDLESIFQGKNGIAKAINHTLTQGVSPSRFIDIKIFREEEPRKCDIIMDWENKLAKFKDGPEHEGILHIAIYYDRDYINTLEIELGKYNNNRIVKTDNPQDRK
mgnify:CR=1 FL=1